MKNHDLNQRKMIHNFQKTKIQIIDISFEIMEAPNSRSTVLHVIYSAGGQKPSTQSSTPSKNILQELGEVNPLSD